MNVCPVPGCPELTSGGKCKTHRREDRKRWPDKRPSASKRGYDAQHRKDRERYLARHPVCEEPDCDDASTVLDHIDGLGPKGPAGHSEHNWKALCAPCHGRKTAKQTPGGFLNQR